MIKPLACFALAGALSFAQGPSASVVGTVTDATGGVIAGAAVKARNVETDVEQVTITNPAGAYRIVGLQAGAHELTISAPQFSTFRQTGIVLRVGEEVRSDASLKPGAVEQTIEVTASAASTAT